MKTEDPGVKRRLNHLKPVVKDTPFTVQFIDDSSDPKKVRLVHANGETLNEMMKNKLLESDDSVGYSDMQGKALNVAFQRIHWLNLYTPVGKLPGGDFAYNKCHVAEFAAAMPDVIQKARVLHVESPQGIFLAPEAQLSCIQGLEEMIQSTVLFMQSRPCMLYSPPSGRVCLAKASDKSWYRGVCIEHEGDDSLRIFFPDYGFMVSSGLSPDSWRVLDVTVT